MNKNVKAYREFYDEAVDKVAAEMENTNGQGSSDMFRQQAAEWRSWSCLYETQHPFDMNPNKLKNFLRGKKHKESWLLALWLVLDTFSGSISGSDFEELSMIVLKMSADAKKGKVISNSYPSVELPEEAPIVYRDFALRNPELLFNYTSPPAIVRDKNIMLELNKTNRVAEKRNDHLNTRTYMHWCNMFRAVVPIQSRDTVEDVLFEWEHYCNNHLLPQDPLELWEYRFVNWLIGSDRDTAVKYFTIMYRFVQFLTEDENALKDVPMAHQMLRSLEPYKDGSSVGIDNNWPDLTDARDRALRILRAHTGLSVRKLSKLTWDALEKMSEPQDHAFFTWKRIAQHASPWVFPLISNGLITHQSLKRQGINYILRGLRNPDAGGPIEESVNG